MVGLGLAFNLVFGSGRCGCFWDGHKQFSLISILCLRARVGRGNPGLKNVDIGNMGGQKLATNVDIVNLMPLGPEVIWALKTIFKI
jgi:hypothetical protein